MVNDQISNYPKRALKNAIVAWRRDGFCERLVTILNAKLLAEHFGLPYWFSWPLEGNLQKALPKSYRNPPGIVSDFEALFSETELQAHYLDEETTELPVKDFIGKQYYIGSVVLLNSIKSFKNRTSGLDFWLAPSRLKPEVANLVDRAKLPEFFRKDLFAEPANQIMAAVDKLDLPPKRVAIHYRAGDVIHGNSRIRFANPLWKSLSLPVAAHFCDEFTKQGFAVYVLGATKSELTYLAERFGRVYSIYDLDLPETDISGSILGDLVLMSRCQTLVSAGGSGVSELAGYLGPVENVSKSDLLTPVQEEQVLRAAVLSAEFADFQDRQKAFSYFNLFYVAENAPFEELDGWLKAAFLLDKENYHYLALRFINALAHSKPLIADKSIELFRTHATDLGPEQSLVVRKKLKRYLRLNNKRTGGILQAALEADGLSWEDHGIVDSWINRN